MRTAGGPVSGVRSVSLPEGPVETQSGAARNKPGAPAGSAGRPERSDAR